MRTTAHHPLTRPKCHLENQIPPPGRGAQEGGGQCKRREQAPFSHEVRFRAAQKGEADALAALALEEQGAFVRDIGGPTYISSLKGKRLGEYRAAVAEYCAWLRRQSSFGSQAHVAVVAGLGSLAAVLVVAIVGASLSGRSVHCPGTAVAKTEVH